MICSHVSVAARLVARSSTLRYGLLRTSISHSAAARHVHASPHHSPLTIPGRYAPVASHSISSAHDSSTMKSLPASILTPGQLSRAAAHAVRALTRTGAFSDALYIVNALHASPIDHVTPTTIPILEQLVQTARHQPVSVRLAAHCFLHDLLRSGRTRQAARFSEAVMSQGIYLRSRTLQALMQQLCRPLPSVFDSLGPRNWKRIQPNEVLFLDSGCVQDPSCQAAIRILEHARRYGHRRTHEMYDVLIRACLLQGEIIVASLLFALLVKEFASTRPIVDSPVPGHIDAVLPRHSKEDHERLLFSTMQLILRDVKSIHLRDPRDSLDERRLESSLQALANLAMLLEQEEFVLGNVSSLLRALYSCPKTDTRVWIIRNGKSTQVAAYPFFQEVLLRILQRMKSYPVGPPLPLMELASYNTLLSYALRHRLSPSMATDVLEHMTNRRQPPLQPSIATYNILFRSATLLRLPYIPEQLLSALQIEFNHGESQTSSSSLVISCDIGESPVGMQRETLRIPETLLKAFSSLKPDLYTLTSYISHITATGNPHGVKELVFHLLPELAVLFRSGVNASTKSKLHYLCLKRSVRYGPYFFTVVLNALVKAGLTGLAERIWILAQQAQYASSIPEFALGGEQWRLGIEAYTVLMQGYAAEASRTVRVRRHSKHMARAVGFGWSLYTRKQLRAGKARHVIGRRLAMLLYRTVLFEDKTMFKSLLRIRGGLHGTGSISPLPPPLPDSRFFNAALDALCPRRSSAEMRHRPTVTRNTSWAFMTRRTPLQQVAHGITSAGYRLPKSLQELVECDDIVYSKPSTRLDRSPYAFSSASHPPDSNRLPITNTRSIPIRPRRSPRGMRKKWGGHRIMLHR
ncbi:hypothetical protein BXZ70DRAFT_744067 [Cristinia sonorae]|uniref:Uncharacterized protein n=1 Tax=Cristinia sonorae TaxID=1940300 RepID=A0A8K0UE27_9AGAR|nr:hypothetical protein BXZ70DRAFT_744067 [Cristinia sonorae]